MNSDSYNHTVSDDEGSTVIEIIVAFAIVSLGLIQGFDLIASSARSGAALAEKKLALSLAQNQLALLRTASTPESARTSEQTDNGFGYSVAIAPVNTVDAPDAGNVMTRAHKVTVRVNKNQRELISLETWALFPFDRQ